VRLFEKEVLLYPGNNRRHERAPQPPSVSFKQVEIARTADGARRLYRGELRSVVTGFIEKHFTGETMTREFAHGGPKNGVTEAVAKARFNGIVAKPAVEVDEPAPKADLPDFVTKAKPMVPSKPARPKAAPVASKPAPKKAAPGVTDSRSMTRKEGLALASGLLRAR
jgi:hypothetical protein